MTTNELSMVYEIADKLGKEEILLQLSEECSELVQAALKYRRSIHGLTPKTEDETYKNLVEELSDVLMNIEQVLYLFDDRGIREDVDEMHTFKAQRWYNRTTISQNVDDPKQVI